MTVLCWNCRGTAARGFANLIRDLRYDYRFSSLIPVETHMSGQKATNIIQKIGFDGRFI